MVPCERSKSAEVTEQGRAAQAFYKSFKIEPVSSLVFLGISEKSRKNSPLKGAIIGIKSN